MPSADGVRRPRQRGQLVALSASTASPGPHRLRLRIAGVGIDFEWSGASLDRDCTWPFYEPFVATDETAAHAVVESRLSVRCGALPRRNGAALVFDARPNRWRLYASDHRYVFEVFSTQPPHRRTHVALMSCDLRAGDVHVTPARPAWSLTRLMRPFGELLMVNLLGQGHGALMHALGVDDHGRGLLFVGASGAGKTTLSELYRAHGDVTVLSDERVIVTRRDGRFWLSGTPWPGGGFVVSPDTVPLREIFFLEHGPRNALLDDAPRALYGLLFQQMFLPFWNREALDFAMAFAGDLIRSLPAHRLSFVNDASVIEFLGADVAGVLA